MSHTSAGRIAALVALTASLALAAPAARAGDDEADPEVAAQAGDPIKTLLDFDAIPAIHDPGLVSREQADKIMADDELVIGLVGEDGVARAYSTVALDHHEILNDWAGETPIGVTW